MTEESKVPIARKRETAGETVAKPTVKPAAKRAKPVAETGGPKGPEPTRFGDWERGGRCIDF